MPRAKKKAKRKPIHTFDHFVFAVDEWKFGYGLHANQEAYYRRRDGPGWEHHDLRFLGPLLCKTKRKIDSVDLTIYGDGLPVAEWDDERDRCGAILQLREGVLTASVWIPPAAFTSVMTVTAAGHAREVHLSVRDLKRGHGLVYGFTVTTETTPDEDLGE